jgi:hypothetical protein
LFFTGQLPQLQRDERICMMQHPVLFDRIEIAGSIIAGVMNDLSPPVEKHPAGSKIPTGIFQEAMADCFGGDQ